VLENALHATQGLDHVRAVVVEVPQLAVVPGMRELERVRPAYLILLKL
jgi:hypothetical protein